MACDNHNASGAELVTSLGTESFTGPATPEVGRVGWVGDHPKSTMNPHRARVSEALHGKVQGLRNSFRGVPPSMLPDRKHPTRWPSAGRGPLLAQELPCMSWLTHGDGGGKGLNTWLHTRHLGLCPEANVPLQGRQGSRGCIPDAPGETDIHLEWI